MTISPGSRPGPKIEAKKPIRVNHQKISTYFDTKRTNKTKTAEVALRFTRFHDEMDSLLVNLRKKPEIKVWLDKILLRGLHKNLGYSLRINVANFTEFRQVPLSSKYPSFAGSTDSAQQIQRGDDANQSGYIILGKDN
jgi:hypothetical protein